MYRVETACFRLSTCVTLFRRLNFMWDFHENLYSSLQIIVVQVYHEHRLS